MPASPPTKINAPCPRAARLHQRVLQAIAHQGCIALEAACQDQGEIRALANELDQAGYSAPEIAALKAEVDHYTSRGHELRFFEELEPQG